MVKGRGALLALALVALAVSHDSRAVVSFDKLKNAFLCSGRAASPDASQLEDVCEISAHQAGHLVRGSQARSGAPVKSKSAQPVGALNPRSAIPLGEGAGVLDEIRELPASLSNPRSAIRLGESTGVLDEIRELPASLSNCSGDIRAEWSLPETIHDSTTYNCECGVQLAQILEFYVGFDDGIDHTVNDEPCAWSLEQWTAEWIGEASAQVMVTATVHYESMCTSACTPPGTGGGGGRALLSHTSWRGRRSSRRGTRGRRTRSTWGGQRTDSYMAQTTTAANWEASTPSPSPPPVLDQLENIFAPGRSSTTAPTPVPTPVPIVDINQVQIVTSVKRRSVTAKALQDGSDLSTACHCVVTPGAMPDGSMCIKDAMCMLDQDWINSHTPAEQAEANAVCTGSINPTCGVNNAVTRFQYDEDAQEEYEMQVQAQFVYQKNSGITDSYTAQTNIAAYDGSNSAVAAAAPIGIFNA